MPHIIDAGFGPGYRITSGAFQDFFWLLSGGSKKGQQADIEQAKGIGMTTGLPGFPGVVLPLDDELW